MFDDLRKYARRPALYEPSTSRFWDDDHISKGMLNAHLNPEWDAATRNHAFVDQSADWISRTLPPEQYPRLLDLGCGPGLYAERFHRCGYRVTGIDISGRSLDYARDSAHKNGYDINYLHRNYIDSSLYGPYDCAVMIYCDYGALSEVNRKKLLSNIHSALRPGGRLLLDVFTTLQYKGRAESTEWSYCVNGFWSPNPHLCLDSFCRYDETNTMLSQTIVITSKAVECFNIWDQVFDTDSLKSELEDGGFSCTALYADVAGAQYLPESTVICAIASKEG